MPVERLTLKELSSKLVALLAILSGQKCQTLHCLSLEHMALTEHKCVFRINTLIKQSRSGKHLAPIELMGYGKNPSLCVLHTIKEYLCRTKNIRKMGKLFVSYLKPHGPVSKDTLARWIRDTLNRAGVDTELYGAHSTRSPSTSAVAARGTLIGIIMKVAG